MISDYIELCEIWKGNIVEMNILAISLLVESAKIGLSMMGSTFAIGQDARQRLMTSVAEENARSRRMEEWKEIKGFEGMYVVSNLGNVKRLERYKRCGAKGQTLLEEQMVKPYKNFRGYYRVYLSVDGKNYPRFVHKLVAEAFVPNDEKKPQINHIDGNKENNNANNLEWVTNQENNIHASDMGLKKSKKIIIVETDEVFNSIGSCARHIGGSRPAVSKRLNGYIDTPYKGYHFKYYEEREGE